MRKTPRKTKQWAQEAYESLQKAILLFREEYPSPTEDEKLELVNYAVPFAAMNRGYKKATQVEQAYQFVYENLVEDLKRKESGEEVDYSILFLLAYLDAHLSFGIFSESKSDDIMGYLSEHYEISVKV